MIDWKPDAGISSERGHPAIAVMIRLLPVSVAASLCWRLHHSLLILKILKNLTIQKAFLMEMLTRLLPQALVINQPEVDLQHEQIFTCIESLKISCVENTNPTIEMFDDLLLFIGDHFATEERIAQQHDLEFSAHAKTHRDSLYMLSKALDEVRREVRDVHSFLRFIEYWFERHIIEEDKPFGALLKT